MLITRLHLHVVLTRRTSVRKLGTFQRAVPFCRSGSIGYEYRYPTLHCWSMRLATMLTCALELFRYWDCGFHGFPLSFNPISDLSDRDSFLPNPLQFINNQLSYPMMLFHGENYIMRSLMICTHYPILCGW
jgi:hypothetical protein